MQNIESSIKFYRRLPQRPTPLARVDPVRATAPLYSSWDVFCHHQISAQSLEAMAVIVLNPLVGIQNSACMLHAISLAAQLTTQSQHLIVDFHHFCPLHNSLCNL